MSQVLQIPFVGRKSEQQRYQEFLARETPWVMLITGLGGNGKSMLLAHLDEHPPSGRCVIRLNFADESLRGDALKALEHLAEQLGPRCDARRAKAFQEALDKGRSKLSESSLQMNQMIHVGDYASLRGASLHMDAGDTAIREKRRQVREQVLRAFYAQLDTFHPEQLVLLLDTCEWLNEPAGTEVCSWVLNDLLRGIRDHMQKRHRRCSVVIASRIRLPLELIDEYEQDHLELPMLDQKAVEEYLSALGMQDVILRQHIYTITHGHPLFVSSIGALWKEQPFSAGDLPRLPEEISQQALLKVHERILDKRLKTPFRELSSYGVLLRSFDLPLLRAVFPEWLPESEPGTADQFKQLIQYPYIKSLGNRRYAFHDLLRETQAAEIREQEYQKWRLYHERALKHLSQTRSYVPDRYYHALAYDEESGMEDWWQALQEVQLRGSREQLGVLLQVAFDSTLKLSSTSCAKRAYRQGRFYYYTEQWKKALQSYSQALAFCQQTKDRLGEANILKAMGDAQQMLKDLSEALQCYQQALLRYQKLGSKLGEANVLQALGDVQQANKDVQGALQSYEQALAIFQQMGSPAGEANVRKALGDVQRFNEDWQWALQNYRQALPLYRQVGDRLGEANVWKAQGDIQRLREEMPAAMHSYGKALTLYQQLGSHWGEASVWKAMGDVQQANKDVQGASQSYGNALALYQQVEALSEQASVWKAMGDIQQHTNDIQAALESYERALSLYQQAGSHSGEAKVLQAMGDVQRINKDIAAALQSYEQALALYQQTGNRLGEANCYQAQGRIALQQENYQKALHLYTNACQLYGQMLDSYSQYSYAYSLYYRSRVYDAMNDRQHAIADVEMGLKIAQYLHLPFVDMFRERLSALRGSLA